MVNKMRIRAMKRYLIPILTLSLLASGTMVGCAPDLPKEIHDQLFFMGNDVGHGWGYWLIDEDKNRTDIFWTRPHAVDEAQKFNPKVNIRDFYIPKGYWTMEDAAEAHLPDGTPLNDKQKRQAIEAYNWGFYTGFLDGSKDCLEGKPHRRIP